MAISVTHAKVSSIADDPSAVAAGQVVPSDWNAAHTITMATGKLLGRYSSGTGAVQEVTLGSNLTLDSLGVLDAVGGGGGYTLPTASTTTLGGVKVDGTSIVIDGSGIITAVGGGGGGSGTVTSVAVSVPTGLSVTGSPITTTGTIAIGLQSGYSIPTTTKQGEWDTAYTDRLKWDGGSTGLNAATARTSLGLATVASTGAYSDLSGTPSPYTLPTASTSVLGGVKVDGTSITITGGVISASGGGGGGGLTSAQAVGRAMVFGGRR